MVNKMEEEKDLAPTIDEVRELTEEDKEQTIIEEGE